MIYSFDADSNSNILGKCMNSGYFVMNNNGTPQVGALSGENAPESNSQIRVLLLLRAKHIMEIACGPGNNRPAQT